MGTKGGAATSQQLTTIRAGLQDVKSMGLGAKAAIAAVLYELGNLSHQSIETGLALQQTANLTGINIEALQKYAFALQQSGVSADDTIGSITRLQAKMTDLALSKSVPDYFAAISHDVNIDPKRFRDTLYMFDKLKEFAQMHKSTPDLTRNMLSPLVGNDKVIQAMMTGTFDPKKTPGSQMYTAGQTKALAADAIKLKNITSKWEHFLGKLTAEHGNGVLDKLGSFSTAIMQLVTALDQLGNSLHVFDVLGDASDVGTGLAKYLAAMATPTSAALKKSKHLQDVDLENRRKEFHRLHPELKGGGGTTINNNIDTTIHHAEPAKEGDIDKNINHAVKRAYYPKQTGEIN